MSVSPGLAEVTPSVLVTTRSGVRGQAVDVRVGVVGGRGVGAVAAVVGHGGLLVMLVTPAGSGSFTCTVTVRVSVAPTGTLPMVQVTTPAENVPPSEALTKRGVGRQRVGQRHAGGRLVAVVAEASGCR